MTTRQATENALVFDVLKATTPHLLDVLMFEATISHLLDVLIW